MDRLLFIILATLLTTIFSSCWQNNNGPGIENALLNTISKFPQLPKGRDSQSSFYKLVRSVTIGETGIEIQLRSTPDTIVDPQKIIIVINQAKKLYAIPLFSNTYHSYWRFQFDSVLASEKTITTTFENEIKNCLSQLNLYDTLGTAGIVLDEMLFSILQCQHVTDTDSLNFQSIALTNNNNYTLPSENTDSCSRRLQENWQEMKKAFHPSEFYSVYTAYWDQINNRVYQFDFKNFGRKRKLEFTMKNYRLDCVYHLIYM